MKKLSILLFILFSIQLCGCSDQVSEINEIDPLESESSLPSSETLSFEENDTKEFEAPAEEIQDDNSGIFTEQGDDSVSIQNTASTENAENMDIPAQDTTLQQEETATTVNDSYYSAVTDIPRADVESYAVQVKQHFLEHDWSAISSEISYPITISDITYNSSADFLDASNSFDGNLDEAFYSALEEEDCAEMFCNWQGIMLGETGQIWISEVLDAESTSQGLKIIAINGLLKE